MEKLINRFRIFLEQYLVAGVGPQLFFVICTIAGISFFGGTAVYLFDDSFSNWGESVWWAFLRLTDPGYLGEDHGLFKRIVSTLLTVLGYILFLGTLITIILQAMYEQLKNLETGMTPIREDGHILILGYSTRTILILRELLEMENEFISPQAKNKNFKIVILAKELNSQLIYQLKEELGQLWNAKRIILRAGDPLKIEDLRRVDFLHSSSILMPGSNESVEQAQALDNKNIKTILTIKNFFHAEEKSHLPPIVIEMFSKRKALLAKKLYEEQVTIIESDLYISRILSQNIRDDGLAYFFKQILGHNCKNKLYLKYYDGPETASCGPIRYSSGKSLFLGLLKAHKNNTQVILNPDDSEVITPGDQLIFLAPTFREISFDTELPPSKFQFPTTEFTIVETLEKNILLLGWNQHASTILRELSEFDNARFNVTSLSRFGVETRKKNLEKYDFTDSNLDLQFLIGDYTHINCLESINLEQFSNIIILSNDWFKSEEESDARSILGYLLIQDLLKRKYKRPDITIELMDPENEKLFPGDGSDILAPPLILGHLLARFTLKPDIKKVYTGLLHNRKTEIIMLPFRRLHLTPGIYKIEFLRHFLFQKKLTLLGVSFIGERVKKYQEGDMEINPPPEREVELKGEMQLILFANRS